MCHMAKAYVSRNWRAWCLMPSHLLVDVHGVERLQDLCFAGACMPCVLFFVGECQE